MLPRDTYIEYFTAMSGDQLTLICPHSQLVLIVPPPALTQPASNVNHSPPSHAKGFESWSCTIIRWPPIFTSVKTLLLVNWWHPTYRNKICIDVITRPLRKNHSAMIIWADISIPVQVLVLWFSSFQKCIIIIQTFIPYVLQIKLQTISTRTHISIFILLYSYWSTVNTFTHLKEI